MMASASLKLLLLLLCSYHTLIARGGDDRSYKVLATGSVKTDAVCSEPKATPSSGGATVPLHHRHGPCSQLLSKKVPTFEEMLRGDQLRACYIQRKFSGAGDVQQSDATVPTTLGSSLSSVIVINCNPEFPLNSVSVGVELGLDNHIHPSASLVMGPRRAVLAASLPELLIGAGEEFRLTNSLEYVITVGIGSPVVTQTVLIDTGSDVSWVQCKPCSQCHSQADPLFDPSASTTYSRFSCSSAACAQLGLEGNGCSSSQCQYIVKYGDGSRTTGTYSSDTLALGSNAVKSFQFGCSHAESGFDNQTDGLMGLGGGAQSLVSQTAGTFGTAFYCLPTTSSSSGFLTLGAASSGFTTTPMLRSSKVPTFYGVLLQGIMVGGKQLNVAPSVFSVGSIMDSGTVITRLPPTAYSALSSAFKAGMKQYPPAPPSSILDTCFDFTGLSSITIPTVALVFSGSVTVDLDPNGIIISNCLAFAATSNNNSTGIIGNVQQRTFEVLYDAGRAVVGFTAGAC
ncbi:Aspartyl protease family protein [Dichanthelium oligosanthes]|uniref:Aspartyl protease family protein n=1 Tax=Dichanthelium oligosanthes TaxID=888268 RepID=A0A1E5WD58_9POAL|nr:Aspartyl protease family protein [Dichanthelium oligosanthes]